MKYVIFALLLGLGTWSSILAADGPLEGCTDPEVIAKGLGKLHNSDWRKLSLDRVQALWPDPVEGLDCRDGQCSSGQSQGRIIHGQCECCELFTFRGDRATGGQQLDGVIIHYTTHRKEEATAVAKKLAKAAGLADAKVATIGTDPAQTFSWKETTTGGMMLFTMEVHLRQNQRAWKVYLNLGRQAP